MVTAKTPKIDNPPALRTEIPARTDAEPAAETKIAVRDLQFYYGKFHALIDIDMTVPARHVTALIGPSGCGKSTFLRMLNRMNDLIEGTHHTGQVQLDGHDIYDRRTDVGHLRKRVGMVFQRPNPFPMSIYDNVAYGPRIHGIGARKVLDGIVERTLRDAALWDEIKDKLRQSAFALSGGQQQRLCIARVLAVQPDVLLMDEPASALDPNSTFRIEELIADLKRTYTIVIVTHNMQQAARCSDKTAFFYLGKLIEYADTRTIFMKPANAQTEAYVSGRFG